MQNQDAGDREQKEINDLGQKDSEPNSSEQSGNRQPRQEGVEGDALAWLEGPAFNAPIEEMPTLQWPETNTEPEFEDDNSVVAPSNINEAKKEEPVDNLEDAMNWLEELAAGQGTPIDEMPTLISGGQYDDTGVEDIENRQEPLEITGKTSTLAEHDSDPMAWLEQLAVDQSSPLEELPSVADRLLASEIISQNEIESYLTSSNSGSVPMSIEVDEALNYLEQLAFQNGIDLSQIDIEDLKLQKPPEKSLATIDLLAEQETEPSTAAEIQNPEETAQEADDWDTLSSQIPDDPDEALKWLGSLAEEDSPNEDLVEFKEVQNKEQEVSSKDAIKEGQHGIQNTDDQIEDFHTFDDMPDDPDEVMEWMQRFADQESVPKEKEVDQKTEPLTIESEKTSQKRSAMDKEIMAYAEKALDAGDIEKATEYYQDILESGTGGQQIIQELEKAVKKMPGSPDLFRLLGDAYMQDGQMQKALKTYRKGFDHL